MVAISGSAYTYAYATLGEVVALDNRWDLILEYAVGNVAVAISWPATSRVGGRLRASSFPTGWPPTTHGTRVGAGRSPSLQTRVAT